MSLTNEQQTGLMVEVHNVFGGFSAAAAGLGVAVSTVYRWYNCDIQLEGVALFAIRAVLRHPEDYKEDLK